MSKQCTWYLAAMIAGLVGCAGSDDVKTSSTDQAVAGTDTLFAGEGLAPGQSISQGDTTLIYQGDNNLVLYVNGVANWWTGVNLDGPTGSFQMQNDCNAVLYDASGAIFSTGTWGKPLPCFARVIEGDWFVCSGTAKVFSLHGGGDCGGTPPHPPPPSYIGCYVDAPTRALPAQQNGSFSIQACIQTCANQGYTLAGSQFYDQCFCGNILNYGHVADSECNTPCNAGGGNCGGVWRNSISWTAFGGGHPPPPDCIDRMCPQ
jgi:hypothetical protein